MAADVCRHAKRGKAFGMAKDSAGDGIRFGN
jgi:hypothetical protein